MADNHVLTDRYAIYLGDCVDTLARLPEQSCHLSIYSPPFGGLYHYSSDVRDLSNADGYEDFFQHYEYVVRGVHRVTMPGRMTLVHCMDIPTGNSGKDDGIIDFSGDIIRLHQRCGWRYKARYCVWKEPLTVRNRTMVKALAHAAVVEDASRCRNAAADYLLAFQREGDNPVPIRHPHGLMDYAGERRPPTEVLSYRGWTGKQIENRYSHWVWRQYASAFWDDVRLDRVLPFRTAKDRDDERHVHPLQLDVIERAVILWSNPDETVLTPFMGVGSEVYGALINGRRAVGIELKSSYYRQALLNVDAAMRARTEGAQEGLFQQP